MSRIPLVEPEGASPEVAAQYQDLRSWGVPILNVMKLFANHEGFLRGFVEMFRSLYQTPTISTRHRELAYLRASQLNSCHY
jgi:alkylhydroperoxidase family enzyme